MKMPSRRPRRKPDHRVTFLEDVGGLVACTECSASVPFTYEAVKAHAQSAHGAEHFRVLYDIEYVSADELLGVEGDA